MAMIVSAGLITLGLLFISLGFMAVGRGLEHIAKSLAFRTYQIQPMRVSVTPDARRDGWNIDVRKV
jgi:hypothetical protein